MPLGPSYCGGSLSILLCAAAKHPPLQTIPFLGWVVNSPVVFMENATVFWGTWARVFRKKTSEPQINHQDHHRCCYLNGVSHHRPRALSGRGVFGLAKGWAPMFHGANGWGACNLIPCFPWKPRYHPFPLVVMGWASVARCVGWLSHPEEGP